MITELIRTKVLTLQSDEDAANGDELDEEEEDEDEDLEDEEEGGKEASFE